MVWIHQFDSKNFLTNIIQLIRHNRRRSIGADLLCRTDTSCCCNDVVCESMSWRAPTKYVRVVHRADEVMTEAELETEMEGCDDEERMERIVRRLSSRQLLAN